MTSTNKVPTRTPERDRVYDVLDGECEYRNTYHPTAKYTSHASLMLIEAQLTHAFNNWSDEPEGRIATINNLRILAGITVRALEALGPIPREYHVPASANITGTLAMRDKGDKL